MAKMIYAEYKVSSVWNLDKICKKLKIDPANVVEYYVKWDKLFLTYTDAEGDEVEVEYHPNVFCASEHFDWKRPEEVCEVEGEDDDDDEEDDEEDDSDI
jgi:hypothetical protein